MAKKKKRFDPLDYLWTPEEFRYSAALKYLREKRAATAILVLMEFIYYHKSLRHKEGRDYIIFTYKQAGEIGIPRETFRRCLRLLHEAGFIDVQFTTRGKVDAPNHYKLSARWVKFGRADFEKKEWPEGVDNSARFGNTKKLQLYSGNTIIDVTTNGQRSA